MTGPFEHRIDPETLREVPRHPAELADWLDLQLARPAPDDYQWLTRTGLAARLLDRLDLAERQLARAVELAEPHQLVAARIRLADVHQWQGRLELADREFADCLARVTGPLESFAHQHAGKCAYELGDWARARDHFGTALRLRAAADPDLVGSSAEALDAADACLTAASVAVELDRLVPGLHRRCAATGALRHVDRPLEVGALIELAGLLRFGPVPLAVAREVHRYEPGIDAALTALAGTGWLALGPDVIAATPRALPLLAAINDLHAGVAAELWPDPTPVLSTVDALLPVLADGWPVTAAMTRSRSGDGPAARLFDGLRALRYHRADAHAAAWRAEGLTAAQVVALDRADPVRRRIETGTDRLAARAYRRLPAADRDAFLTRLRALPT